MMARLFLKTPLHTLHLGQDVKVSDFAGTLIDRAN